MGKIKQLPLQEIQKIAAGEVIERPANVIKELVENSLDAGSRTITVYLEQGGKSLMRVVDDGCGMSREDAHLCILHHATSKLTTIEDLETLTTFGFRGEALSSIASVSCMTLVTREPDSETGTQLTIAHDRIVKEEVISCNPGTDITITDLFHTIPARKKFLKSDETEWRAIYQLMQAFALSYTRCAFTVYHNKKMVMQCRPTEELSERIKQLYEPYMTQTLLPCKMIHPHGFSLEGTITNPHFMRYDRNSIFIFVNKRWIKNNKLTHALLKGYSGVLQHARYPAAALFITIEPHQVDVNIHPRKEEVHFLHPRRIEIALEDMIRRRLEEHTAHLTATTVLKKPESSLFSSQPSPAPLLQRFHYEHPVIPTQPAVQTFNEIMETVFSPAHVQDSQTKIADNEQHNDTIIDYQLIGQLRKTYIILENESGLVLIDQHATHERVLYELFAQKFDDVAVVPLLFPQVITLNENELQLIEEHANLFKLYGIDMERRGTNHCVVQSLPVILKNESIEDILKDFIALHHEESGTPTLDMLHHALRAQMACKAAVKAGDSLTNEQMHELISSINKAPNRFSCPHGRPTTWCISQYEIERKFKRKV